MKRNCCKSSIKGFTLIELLVVVLIIGILAAIALPQYQKAVFKSRVAGALARVRAFDQAEAEFYLSHGYYAIQPEALALAPGASCISNNAFCQWRITKGLMFQITIASGYAKGNYYQWFCMSATGNSAAEDFCSQHGSYYLTNAGYKYYRLKSIYPTQTIYHGQTHFM